MPKVLSASWISSGLLSEKAIDEFIDSKIKSTYIVIDPLFKDCVFEREGWSEKFRKAE